MLPPAGHLRDGDDINSFRAAVSVAEAQNEAEQTARAADPPL